MCKRRAFLRGEGGCRIRNPTKGRRRTADMERPLIFVERLSTTVGRPLIFTGRLLKGWEQPFSESDIYVHRDFIILGRRMMYWNDMDTVYEVCGFE